GRETRRPDRALHYARQREAERIKPLKADRCERCDEADYSGRRGDDLRRLQSAPDPACKKGAADTDEQANIEEDLGEPNADPDRPVDRLRRSVAAAGVGSANGEHR